jgi:hypothetical protein
VDYGVQHTRRTICFSPFVAALGANLIRQLDVFPRRRWKMALDVRRARGAKIHFALCQTVSDALCSRTWFASALDNCDALVSSVLCRTPANISSAGNHIMALLLVEAARVSSICTALASHVRSKFHSDEWMEENEMRFIFWL